MSPDPVERNRDVASRLGLDYSILADVELRATSAFGLEHLGGGPGGADIPRPAIFLVSDGVVRWRDLTDNWRIRPRSEELLEAVGQLGLPAGS